MEYAVLVRSDDWAGLRSLPFSARYDGGAFRAHQAAYSIGLDRFRQDWPEDSTDWVRIRMGPVRCLGPAWAGPRSCCPGPATADQIELDIDPTPDWPELHLWAAPVCTGSQWTPDRCALLRSGQYQTVFFFFYMI